MKLPIAAQGRELALALVLGAVLALLYELLRLLRLRGRAFGTVLADLLFSLALFLGLLLFTLYGGRGRLRLFALAAIALGFALFRALLRLPFRGLRERRRKRGQAGENAENFPKNEKKQLHLPKKLIK